MLFHILFSISYAIASMRIRRCILLLIFLLFGDCFVIPTLRYYPFAATA